MSASHSPNLWYFMSFAKRLHALRKEQGLTQKTLAEKAGTHLTQIQRYESGETQPNLDALKKLALALHVTTDTLVFDEGEREPADDLKLAFEAVSQFDDEDRAVAKKVLVGLIIQHQNKRFMNDDAQTSKTAAAS